MTKRTKFLLATLIATLGLVAFGVGQAQAALITCTPGVHCVGTQNGDSIYGTAVSDDIDAQGGVDYVYAGDSGDDVTGGGSGDYLYGDAGDDRLDGGGGNDNLYAGGGNHNVLLGGDGDDDLKANNGWFTDELYCGTGPNDVAHADYDLILDTHDYVAPGCETVFWTYQ
jgi:Ca2+-binding RTX toxin-like protein